MDVVVGMLVLLVGASGAAAAPRRLPAAGHGRLVVPAMALSGLLVGAGAAIVRGWDLVGTSLAAAVLVPVLAVVVRLAETRRPGGAA